MEEVNGNYEGPAVGPSGSTEDLSEYTDADESVSAPTEILAEFLSALMVKDYDSALKYCKIILQYEPNHSTAKEFYPLLIQKIAIEARRGDGEEENGNVTTSSSSSSSSVGGAGGESSGDEGSSEGSSEGTTASYSSLEDEEAPSRPSALDNLPCQPPEHNGNSYSDRK